MLVSIGEAVLARVKFIPPCDVKVDLYNVDVPYKGK